MKLYSYHQFCWQLNTVLGDGSKLGRGEIVGCLGQIGSIGQWVVCYVCNRCYFHYSWGTLFPPGIFSHWVLVPEGFIEAPPCCNGWCTPCAPLNTFAYLS